MADCRKGEAQDSALMAASFDKSKSATALACARTNVSQCTLCEEICSWRKRRPWNCRCEVPLLYPCPNEVYESRMETAVAEMRNQGVTQFIFGDLFLEDIRDYHEK